MKIAGIIAEYNPMHNGHVYHISQTREATGCDYLMVVMSGDFVQRGEPAIADKFTRTRWALEAGADLVLELPSAAAVASAERFARGGVQTLCATGVLTHLCFGSELSDVDALCAASEHLAKEPPGFKAALKEQLSLGKSYPRARYDALESCGAPKTLLEALKSPNSILAMEYIRFLRQFGPEVIPVAIERLGSGHDQPGLGGFASASAIRNALLAGDADVYESMPMYVGGRFALGQIPPISLNEAQELILYALLRMSPEELSNLPDVQEGFENVIYRAVRQASSLDELYAELKSKRYTLARCRRIALCALLGIDKALLQTSMGEEGAGYLRVLGFRRDARPLLSAISHHGSMPLIMRYSDQMGCSPAAQALLKLDIEAHNIYALLLGKHGESIPRDFKSPPVMI